MGPAEMMPSTAAPADLGRPAGVTALAAIAAVQGALLGAAGIAVVVARGDRDVQADLEAGTTGLAVTGGLVAALGLLSLLVSLGLLQRSSVARGVCTVVAMAQIASSVYALIALHQVRAPGLAALAASVAVLWLLYGSDRTQAWFAR